MHLNSKRAEEPLSCNRSD